MEEEEVLVGRAQFYFLIDRSGSMAGDKMRMAIEAVLLFLKSLP